MHLLHSHPPGARVGDGAAEGGLPSPLLAGLLAGGAAGCRSGQDRARAILSRLDTYHDRWPHVLYAYPGAGHLVGDFVPYEPAGSAEISKMVPSYATIQEAEPELWQHLLTFLAAFAASSS